MAPNRFLDVRVPVLPRADAHISRDASKLGLHRQTGKAAQRVIAYDDAQKIDISIPPPPVRCRMAAVGIDPELEQKRGLEWLVTARNKVQSLLFRLYEHWETIPSL